MHKSGKHWVRTVMSQIGLMRLFKNASIDEISLNQAEELTQSASTARNLMKAAAALSVIAAGGVASQSAFADETPATEAGTEATANGTTDDVHVLSSTEDKVEEAPVTVAPSEQADTTTSTSVSEQADTTASASESLSASTSESVSTSTSLSASESASTSEAQNSTASDTKSESASDDKTAASKTENATDTQSAKSASESAEVLANEEAQGADQATDNALSSNEEAPTTETIQIQNLEANVEATGANPSGVTLATSATTLRASKVADENQNTVEVDGANENNNNSDSTLSPRILRAATTTTKVSTYAELLSALKNKAVSNIQLTDNIDAASATTSTALEGHVVTVDLAGYSIGFNNTKV